MISNSLTKTKDAFHSSNQLACHLRWANITKFVEVKDLSAGLIKSSIGTSNKASPPTDNGEGNNKNTKEYKGILNQLSGQAHPSEVMALMGPSGSGKTSLLDVLATRSSYNNGIVALNNQIITNHSSKTKMLKRKMAYIKQTDIFFDHLTVKDQLTYTAFLRLGDEYNRDEKRAEVSGHCKVLMHLIITKSIMPDFGPELIELLHCDFVNNKTRLTRL